MTVSKSILRATILTVASALLANASVFAARNSDLRGTPQPATPSSPIPRRSPAPTRNHAMMPYQWSGEIYQGGKPVYFMFAKPKDAQTKIVHGYISRYGVLSERLKVPGCIR